MEKFTILAEDQWYSAPDHKEAKYRDLIGDKRKGRVDNKGFFVNNSDEIRLVEKFLLRDVNGYYHGDYNSGGSWHMSNTIENLIWTLKNDVDPFPERLPHAKQQLTEILREDLPQILLNSEKKNLTVCIVPRSKMESFYRADQLYFREVISEVVNGWPHFENGANYIIRCKVRCN